MYLDRCQYLSDMKRTSFVPQHLGVSLAQVLLRNPPIHVTAAVNHWSLRYLAEHNFVSMSVADRELVQFPRWNVWLPRHDIILVIGANRHDTIWISNVCCVEPIVFVIFIVFSLVTEVIFLDIVVLSRC